MNDKIRTIKPEFKNIRIDETHCYIDEIRAKFGKIYSLHLFDKSENTYLCSMSPSYYLHYLGTVVEFKNEGDEENDELVNLRDELENGDCEPADYYSCSTIDRLPEEDVDACEFADDAEWATKEEYDELVEDMIEASRGNPSW